MNVKWTVFSIGVVYFLTFLAGCGDSKPVNDGGKGPTSSESAKSEQKSTHGEWWCNEHGMPEEICAQCSSKLAADFKKKGDWCEEHDRPDSQCFICHPELKDRFAAQYRAKYGKEPPPLEEKEEAEGHEHGTDTKDG